MPTPAWPQSLIRDASAALAAASDPVAASAMAAYMKTEMPFHGVKKPARVVILRQLVRDHAPADHAAYEAAVNGLWGLPYREERYLAIAYARAFTEHVVPASIPLYERLVVSGAWWDFVDEIAAHLVGGVLLRHREEVSATLDGWIASPDLWLRRTAILAQLRHGSETDVDRMAAYCLATAHEREYFIRKAIGWALRQYARTDPDWVRQFVSEHREAWSGLTFREATKYLDLG